MGFFVRLITGILPVFTFMGDLWIAFPPAMRVVITLFFSIAVGFVMLRNLIL